MLDTYDVIVVGAGNAALAAAVAAHDAGARVVVLEKAPREERGGNSMLTGEMRFPFETVDDLVRLMPPDPDPEVLKEMRERFIPRSQSQLWDEIMTVTDGMSDPALLERHIGEAYNTMLWLRSHGHQFEPMVEETTDNPVMMQGFGYGLQQRNFSYLERNGTEIRYLTSAVDLLQDNRGAVVGVRARVPDGCIDVAGKAVVLACGGFEANPEMRARYLGPEWGTVKVRGVPYNTGDGLRMALNVGAMPWGSWGTCHASPQAIDRPPHTMPSSQDGQSVEALVRYVRYAYPFGIMVNVQGRRFIDEADDIRARTYAKMGRAILCQEKGIAFQIFDARARRMGLIDLAYGLSPGLKAQTLQGLAQEMGVDEARFVVTVREYNSATPSGPFQPSRLAGDGQGTRGLTPSKSNFAMPIDEPPFEGFPVCCGITFTFGGLQGDPRTGQAQHVAGGPILGLYIAGEMLGGLWHSNYTGGSGMMAGATFGRLAGTNAAKSALS